MREYPERGESKQRPAFWQVLLVDEVSMLAGEFLDLLDEQMRKLVAKQACLRTDCLHSTFSPTASLRRCVAARQHHLCPPRLGLSTHAPEEREQ